MTPIHIRTLLVSALALAIVGLAPAAFAQDAEGEDLAIAPPDFNKSKVLQEAGLVQPLPPRTLKSMLPKSFAGLQQTRVSLGDFVATTETLGGGTYVRVQAFAGPRVRVSAESMNGLSLDELVAAMKEIDLSAFAALAPDAPPDLSERQEQPK